MKIKELNKFFTSLLTFCISQASQNDSEKKTSDLLSSILSDSDISEDNLWQNQGVIEREQATQEHSYFMKPKRSSINLKQLSFFKQEVTKYSLLSSVSKVFLNPPPTSTASERLVQNQEVNWE